MSCQSCPWKEQETPKVLQLSLSKSQVVSESSPSTNTPTEKEIKDMESLIDSVGTLLGRLCASLYV